MSVQPDSIEFARHDVTAVLVTHDGERWVGQVLDAIAGQERPIQRFVGVDTGSRDRTLEILYDTVGEGRVITRPRDTGFGHAAGFAVNAVFGGRRALEIRGEPDEPVEWIWLLHDDSEPDPEALRFLLALVDEDPTIGVVGPKIRGWYNRRDLLEVGTTIAPNGRRETGLDRGETDQGQHDGQREVLAVSSAGMLVRRDVWETLGGFDRALPMMRDDQDFCWRVNGAGWRVMINTDAVIYHAEAAARERRKISTWVGRTHFLDRAHALFVLLANVPLRRLPLTVLRLAASTIGRTIGYAVAKLPDYAIDEALSLLYVIGRFPAIIRARLVRRRHRRVPFKTMRPLFPARWSQLRHMVDTIAERLPHSHIGADPTAGKHRAAETGPVGEDAEDLETNDLSAIKRFIRHPVVVLSVTLTMLTVLASRQLIGTGRLMGGALLPAPSDWHRLWDTYFGSWHAVGAGSGTSAPPYLAVVGTLAAVLGGDASRAVDVLVLGCVPLAGLSAYLAARRVVTSRLLRMWAAGAYALLPAVTGAVAGGRLGTAVGAVLLPVAALGAVRALGLDGRPPSWRAAWATGLVLSVMAAFVPVAWLLAIVLGGAAVLLRIRRIGRLLRLVAILVTPALLLLPWSITLLRDPTLAFLEVGLPGPNLSDPNLSPLALLLLHPGGPGMYPMLITLGILLAGLAALLRAERRGLVIAGWAVVVCGFVVAVVMSRIHVIGPNLAEAVPAWPGFATVVMGAGMLLAALIGAEGARERLASSSFGWRHPTSLAMSVLAIVSPAVAGLWWIYSGANGPLERRDPVVLPAYVAAEGQSTDRPRTLVLQKRGEGLLSYTLLRDIGPRLGDAETAPNRARYAGLDQVVRDVIGGTGEREVEILADYAVRYVLVTRPVDPELIKALDAVPGLSRVSATDGAALWRLEGVESARLRVVSAEGETRTIVPSEALAAAALIPGGEDGRLLVLSESADPGWRATIDGQPLASRTFNNWAQAFEVPAAGGQIELSHVSQTRTYWLLAQLSLLVFVVILALPGGRRVVEEEYEDIGPIPERVRRPMPGVEPAVVGGFGRPDFAEPVPAGAGGYPVSGPNRPELEPAGAPYELVEPHYESMEPRFEPVEPRYQPMEPRYEPVEPRYEPVEPRYEPVSGALEPVEPAFHPGEPAFEPAEPSTGGHRLGRRGGVGAAVAGVAAARAVTGQQPVVHPAGPLPTPPQAPHPSEPELPVYEPATGGYEPAGYGPAGPGGYGPDYGPGDRPGDYGPGEPEPDGYQPRHGRHAAGPAQPIDEPLAAQRYDDLSPDGASYSYDYAGRDQGGNSRPGYDQGGYAAASEPEHPAPRHGRSSYQPAGYDQQPDPLAYDPTYDPAFNTGPLPAVPLASYEVLHDEPYPAGQPADQRYPDQDGYETLPEYGGFDPLPAGGYPAGGYPTGGYPAGGEPGSGGYPDQGYGGHPTVPAQEREPGQRQPWDADEDERANHGQDDWPWRSS